MNRSLPAYNIEVETKDYIVVRDLGPWDHYPTITNYPEAVVERLADRLGDRKLYYFDSEGQLDGIIVTDGKFAGFTAGGPE